MSMKTSTILLLVTAALIMISLGTYDLQLRAEVRKGKYDKPMYRYTTLPLKDFNRVELRAATVISMRLVRGPFQVLTSPDAQDYLSARVEDSTLIVEGHFPDHYHGTNSYPQIYVACPALCSFRSDARYTVGKDTTITGTTEWFWYKTVTIHGFEGDSLHIQEENGSNVTLDSISVKKLTAVLTTNSPKLTINDNNHIDSSDLTILEHGQLQVTGLDISRLHYYLGDSATITLNGMAVRHLKTD